MNKGRHDLYIKIVLIILILCLGYACYTLWLQYQHIQRVQTINDQRTQFSNLLNHGPLGLKDVTYIAPWMTFKYVSIAFKVPTEYIASSTQIHDSRFPNVSINRYSRDAGLDPQNVINEVKDAVTGYLMTTSIVNP